ncbi:hypothetical protein AB0M12_40185 [Nocardia vinacea]|uniref:hypothetical protein n=1 Tax=Nocardia vinacea TaxID=96468 RepID=UPI00343FF8EF
MLLKAANQLASRSGVSTSVPLRRAFLLRGEEGEVSPMSQLLITKSGAAGGRGGKRRLALLLTALWVCSREPFNTSRAASWWAEMIGLLDPTSTAATRSVITNLRELAERGFIEFVPGKAGYSPTVTLLNELGTREPYQRPIHDERRNYIQVPHALWTSDGLIGKLSAPGLAMFLIVVSYFNINTNKGKDIWFSDQAFRDRHGLAEATRLNGLNELVNLGVLTLDEQKTDIRTDDGYRVVRRRFYTITPGFHPPSNVTGPLDPESRKTMPPKGMPANPLAFDPSAFGSDAAGDDLFDSMPFEDYEDD